MPTTVLPTTIVKGSGVARWNGTDIGYIADDIEVYPNYNVTTVTEETTGTTPVKLIYSGFSGIISLGCQSMTSAVFSMGTLTNLGASATFNTTYKTGTDLYITRSGTFTFTPDNPGNLSITATCTGITVGKIETSYKRITTFYVHLYCTSINIS